MSIGLYLFNDSIDSPGILLGIVVQVTRYFSLENKVCMYAFTFGKCSISCRRYLAQSIFDVDFQRFFDVKYKYMYIEKSTSNQRQVDVEIWISKI